MLHSISWAQFGSFLLVTGTGFYLLVLGRYYRSEIKSFFSGRGRPPKVFEKGGGSPAVRVGCVGPASLQSEIFMEKRESEDPSQSLFKDTEKVMVFLKEVVRVGAANRVSREELLRQLREVLGNFSQLKGSLHQDAINNFLTRTCSTTFSLLLGEDELEVLWN